MSPLRAGSTSNCYRTDSAVASWIELKEGRAAFMVRKARSCGSTQPACGGRRSGGLTDQRYPRIATSGDELLFALDGHSGREHCRADCCGHSAAEDTPVKLLRILFCLSWAIGAAAPLTSAETLSRPRV